MNKNNSKNQVDKDYEAYNKVANQVGMMSLSRKLFVLREAIDFLALGQPINQLVIDMCYDDLQEALADYKFMQEELNGYHQLSEQIHEAVNDLGVDSDAGALSIEEEIRKQIGEKYDDLLNGLDALNEKNGTLLNLQFYKTKKGIKIKVWDERDARLKRVYDDPYDLAINYQSDLQSEFTKPKQVKLEGKKLSQNKKENIE